MNKAEKELEIMLWTLFVLDFDGTYNYEYEEDYGVNPEVYQIPLDRQIDVENLAKKAARIIINSPNVFESIGDAFKWLLVEHGIKYHYVGNLKIRFGERQRDYLADYIPKEIV